MKQSIIILFILLVSCKKETNLKNAIDIKISNKSLIYYLNPDSLKSYNEINKFPNLKSKYLSTNSLNVNVINNTQKKYLFLVNDFQLNGDNCYELNLYEDDVNIGVTICLINRSDLGIVKNTQILTCLEYRSLNDIDKDKFLRKNNFNNIQKYEVFNFLNNRYVINPNENVKFYYSLKIPYLVEDNVEGLFDPKYFNFKKNKKYEFSVTYKMEKGFEENLPKEIRENLKQNNIEIFYGSIESNRIPIRNNFK